MLRLLIILAGALAIVQAQTVTVLHSFENFSTDGGWPFSTLTEVTPGVFMGTTVGNIFQVSICGAFKSLHSLASTPGFALAQLYPASNGLLYGENYVGLGSNSGLLSLFAISTSGQFQGLQANAYAASPLTEASDGNLYGVEEVGATGSFEVFRIDRTGAITSVYNLGPYSQSYGALLQASDGNLYGTTMSPSAPGTIFKLSLSGEYTILHTFPNGVGGIGGLTEASNGLLYGVAMYDAYTAPAGTDAYTAPAGTLSYSFIFSLSLSGEFTSYHEFEGLSGGYAPPVITGLTEASDGNLYGAAWKTTTEQYGAIFKIGLDGSFRTILAMTPQYGQFPGGQDGPGLIQGSDGALYGTAIEGGSGGLGTVFRIDLGLTPPLPVISYLSPSSAVPNSSVIVAGQHLLGVTEVSFNGVAATTVTSRGPNYVLAEVPPGATSGPVTVTTPNGSVTSKFNFTVQ